MLRNEASWLALCVIACACLVAYCTKNFIFIADQHILVVIGRSLAFLVGSMLIQLSFTEQSLEVSDGVFLGIGSAVRIWQRRIRPLSQL